MKNLLVKTLVFFVIVLFGNSICFQGFSQKKSDDALTGGSVKLAYGYPSEKVIKYLNVSKIVQDMDINGQSMLVNVASYFGCNVRSTGRQGENLNLEIKIDTVAQNIDSPQGISGGQVSEIKDKIFNMVITPSGKSIDLTAAAKIVYNVEGSGETNLAQSFLNFFPALPAGSVKTGDTWVTNDTINSKTASMSLWSPVEAICKFEGIEKINEITCARISATITGRRTMNTQAQGMDINTTGSFTGTYLLYFAMDEGYFIKETVTSRMTGNIEIRDQNMSFPLVMDMVSTNEVVK